MSFLAMRRAGLAVMFLVVALLSACAQSTVTSNDRSLNQLSWCAQKNITFQDNGSQTQSTLSDWASVKPQLGFTVYLPTTLPKDSCLALAGGSIHDPIFGGQLNITWTLGTKGPLAFVEVPRRAGVSDTVQCVKSDQVSDTTICVGAFKQTSVTIAGRLSSDDLTGYFKVLKADVDWVPTSVAAQPTAIKPTATTH